MAFREKIGWEVSKLTMCKENVFKFFIHEETHLDYPDTLVDSGPLQTFVIIVIKVEN